MELSAIMLLFAAYLIGSIPTGLVLAKALSNTDIREQGSGNIGATNVARVLGKKLGILTLVGDLLKGFLPVAAGSYFLSSLSIGCAAGLAAFLGHLFPVYLKFKGGKGVATALGVFLYLSPKVVAIEVVVFVTIVAIWRYVSLGSLVAAATMPLILLWFSFPGQVIILSIAVAALIFIKHTTNIRKLVHGTEHKFGTNKQ